MFGNLLKFLVIYSNNLCLIIFWFNSVACLAALQRHGECLALVNKRLEEETENPDLFIMRARLHELFRNVSTTALNGQDFYQMNVCSESTN